MVGRLEEKLVLQGIGSSPAWVDEIERRNVPVGLSIALQNDSYLPTDATPFYIKGIPILSAFTGAHKDYHTPRDTYDKINVEGHYDITRLMHLISRSLMQREDLIAYQSMKRPENMEKRGMMRAYLGTIPDYSGGDTKGVLLSGVAKGGPAEKAGVKDGDTIIGLGGKKIENIYDYTYAIEALKIDQETSIKVKRGDQEIELKVVPGSRE
jgi:predicted metalloprotease with PDZ domain